MGGGGLLALYCMPRCTGLVARLPLPVVAVSTLSFALTLSFSLCLVFLHADALLLPSRL
jgi:hypothetical protein